MGQIAISVYPHVSVVCGVAITPPFPALQTNACSQANGWLQNSEVVQLCIDHMRASSESVLASGFLMKITYFCCKKRRSTYIGRYKIICWLIYHIDTCIFSITYISNLYKYIYDSCVYFVLIPFNIRLPRFLLRSAQVLWFRSRKDLHRTVQRSDGAMVGRKFAPKICC